MSDDTKATSDAKVHKVGEVLEKVRTVVRPDGGEMTISGGLYVLDVPGVHVVDGQEVVVQ